MKDLFFKTNLMAGAVLLIASGPASAGYYSSNDGMTYPQIYGGLSVGMTGFDVSGRYKGNELNTPSMDLIDGTANIGFKFNPYFAIEGRYGAGLESAQEKGRLGLSHVSVEMKQKHIAGIYARGILPIGGIFTHKGRDNVTLYALLGHAGGKLSHNITDRDGFGGIKGSSRNSGFSYGGGLTVKMNPSWGLKFEYLQLYKDKNVPVEGNKIEQISIGLNYYWSC